MNVYTLDTANMDRGEILVRDRYDSAWSGDITALAWPPRCGYSPVHPLQDMILEKSGPAQAREGDAVAYQFKITNTGNVMLDDPYLNDPLLGGEVMACTKEYLGIDKSILCEAAYQIPAGTAGPLVNTAEAEAYVYWLEDMAWAEAGHEILIGAQGAPGCELSLNDVPAGEAWDSPWNGQADELKVRLRNIVSPVSYQWERSFPSDHSGQTGVVSETGEFDRDGEHSIQIDYPPQGEWGAPASDGSGRHESLASLSMLNGPCENLSWKHWYTAPE
ncbi:MAG: hypothetical protein GY835_23725, partial [bacterium]|nr:hypothetical protein [bacterium]